MSAPSPATAPLFAPFRNAEAEPAAGVPLLPMDAFRRAVAGAVADGCVLSALFAAPDAEGALRLWAVAGEPRASIFHLASARLEGDAYPALTPECPPAHWFEREVAEQWGVVPEGHPMLKPIRFHASRRPGKDAWRRPAGAIAPAVADFYTVIGEGVHEVAVGPVHAGVIEPGHFRFQCHGEKVFQLEIALGYQHRGLEAALRDARPWRMAKLIEVAAGDATVAHAICHAQALEGMAGRAPPPRAEAIRAIALELERLANHIGDLGALAGDIAFLPTSSYCGRLRGDFLNMTAMLCGNRFGRGLVAAGGARHDLDGGLASELAARLRAAFADCENALELLWDSPSAVARFDGAGVVPRADAVALGLVGVAARASGLDRDTRHDFPFGKYKFYRPPLASLPQGDVFARAYVRWLECQFSVRFIGERLMSLPDGPAMEPCGPPRPGMMVVSAAEGWRGETLHAAMTDGDGRFAFYKVVDPSFHNWCALARAMRGEEISNFPLCNKSFNLSYCGHDL